MEQLRKYVCWRETPWEEIYQCPLLGKHVWSERPLSRASSSTEAKTFWACLSRSQKQQTTPLPCWMLLSSYHNQSCRQRQDPSVGPKPACTAWPGSVLAVLDVSDVAGLAGSVWHQWLMKVVAPLLRLISDRWEGLVLCSKQCFQWLVIELHISIQISWTCPVIRINFFLSPCYAFHCIFGKTIVFLLHNPVGKTHRQMDKPTN